MSWTAPSTAIAGSVLTASFWNAQVKENLLVLKTSISNDGDDWTGDVVAANGKNVGWSDAKFSRVSSTSLGVNASLTATRTGLGTTSTDGFVFENTTAAAAGAQQYSPRARMRGYGWKTNSTAASQSVDFAWEVRPVQGTSSPTGNMVWSASINGGSYSDIATLASNGSFSAQYFVSANYVISPEYAFTGGHSLFGSSTDITELRRSTNAQIFRIYNTISGSDYERMLVGWSSNAGSILVGAGGAGQSRSLRIGTDNTSTGNFIIQTAGTDRWSVNSSGRLTSGAAGGSIQLADASADFIGMDQRVRMYFSPSTGLLIRNWADTLYLPIVASNATFGNTTITTSYLAPAAQFIFRPLSDGIIKLARFDETAGVSFNVFTTDGTLRLRNKDNSADGNFIARDGTFTNAISASTSASAPYFAYGTNPATTGFVRAGNNQHFYARTAANSGDVHVIGLDGSNFVVIDTSGQGIKFGSSAVQVLTGAGKIQALTSTYFNSLSFDATNLTGTVALARLSGITTSQMASANISQFTNNSDYYVRGAAFSAGWIDSGTIAQARLGGLSAGWDVSNYTLYDHAYTALTDLDVVVDVGSSGAATVTSHGRSWFVGGNGVGGSGTIPVLKGSTFSVNVTGGSAGIDVYYEVFTRGN